MTPILRRIARLLDAADPIETLANRLGGNELQSLLLHVFAERAARLSPGDLLRRRDTTPAMQPGPNDPRLLHAFDGAAFAAAAAFTGVELPPVTALGAAHVLGGIHQNNVLSALRGLEVLADPTPPWRSSARAGAAASRIAPRRSSCAPRSG